MLEGLVEHLVDERLLVLVGPLLLALLLLLLLLLFRILLLVADDIALIAPAGVLGTLLARQRDLHAGVGLDAPLVGLLAVGEAMDVLTAGPPVARRGQLQGALAMLHRDDVLHAALAVTAFANDH